MTTKTNAFQAERKALLDKLGVESFPATLNTNILGRFMSPENLKELGKIYLETRHTFSTRTSKLVEYTPTPEEVAIYNRVISGETTMSQAAIELSVTAGTGVYAIIGAIGAAMHRSERA